MCYSPEKPLERSQEYKVPVYFPVLPAMFVFVCLCVCVYVFMKSYLSGHEYALLNNLFSCAFPDFAYLGICVSVFMKSAASSRENTKISSAVFLNFCLVDCWSPSCSHLSAAVCVFVLYFYFFWCVYCFF